MPKTYKRKNLRCDKHDFTLRPRSEYTLIPQHYNASFCQQLANKNK